MTHQQITNLIYTQVSNTATRTVRFPANAANTITYSCVISNNPDDLVTEPYFHVDVNTSRTPVYFGDKLMDVSVTIDIYDNPKLTTGTQYAMTLCDQLEDSIVNTIPMIRFQSAPFEILGFTDNNEHFQTRYQLNFTT